MRHAASRHADRQFANSDKPYASLAIALLGDMPSRHPLCLISSWKLEFTTLDYTSRTPVSETEAHRYSHKLYLRPVKDAGLHTEHCIGSLFPISMCHLDTGRLQRAHRMCRTETGKRVGVSGMCVEQVMGKR